MTAFNPGDPVHVSLDGVVDEAGPGTADLTETSDTDAGDHFDALHYLWCDTRFDVTNPCDCGAPVKFREAAEQLAAKDESMALEPIESMALTVARARLSRGENVEPNTAAMLVATVERLARQLAAKDADLAKLRAGIAPTCTCGRSSYRVIGSVWRCVGCTYSVEQCHCPASRR